MLASGEIDFCVTDSSDLVALSVGQTGSGFSAVNGALDFTTSLTLMDNSFNTSTGGILPVAFSSANVSRWFPDATIIPAALTAPTIRLNNGLSWTWSIVQQGPVQALVTDNLTADTTPSLSVNITGAVNSSSSIEVSSTCLGPPGSDPSSFLNSTLVTSFVGEHQGYVAMIVCGGEESSDSYQLIFASGGFHSSNNIAVKPSFTGVPDVGGPAGLSAVTMIYNMVLFAQGTDANVVGDELTAIVQEGADFLGATEVYIRGVAVVSCLGRSLPVGTYQWKYLELP
ncbi:hypothetical protein C8R45DRAFT_1112355 [Mycena sanguinolenta]|nr:hypothetical protein C8R45DRAFT_1112355 [Mycena sanguinolenta]